MCVAFYPVFEDGDGDWPDDINGKCLARAADYLEKVARTNKVVGLYDYCSMTREQMIVELLDGDPDEKLSYDPKALPEVHWHAPEDGLQTVRVLLDSVRQNRTTLDDAECLLKDLEAFERHLAEAANRRVRWHLVVDG